MSENAIEQVQPAESGERQENSEKAEQNSELESQKLSKSATGRPDIRPNTESRDSSSQDRQSDMQNRESRILGEQADSTEPLAQDGLESTDSPPDIRKATDAKNDAEIGASDGQELPDDRERSTDELANKENDSAKENDRTSGSVAKSDKPISADKSEKISAQERAERSSIADDKDSWSFEFDSAEKTEGVAKQWDEVFEKHRESLQDENKTIILRGKASSPGSEQYNVELSEERASAIKNELVARGIDPDKIDISWQGEPVTDAADLVERDNQLDRTVIMNFTERIEGDDSASGHQNSDFLRHFDQRSDQLSADYTKGQRIFESLVNGSIEKIRKSIHMPANPVYNTSSPEKKAELLYNLARDAVNIVSGNPWVAIAKHSVGAMFELFQSDKARDVANERRPFFQAMGEGIAEGLDPSHKPNPRNLRDPGIGKFYSEVKSQVEQLSPVQKYQLAVNLFWASPYEQEATPFDSSARERLATRVNGSQLQRGATFRFENSEFLYK